MAYLVIFILTVAIGGCSMTTPSDRDIEWGCTSHDLINYLRDRGVDRREEILILTHRTEELKDGIACHIKFTI